MSNSFFKITLLTFIFFTVSIGCNKPEVPSENEGETGESESKVSQYVGTWNYTDILLEDGELVVMGNAVGSFTGKGKDIKGSIEITENPNVYSTAVEFTAEISVFGQTQEIPVEQRKSTGTWEEVNGNIVLTDDNGNDINVLTSSENEITFEGDFTEEITLPLGSVDAESRVVFTVAK